MMNVARAGLTRCSSLRIGALALLALARPAAAATEASLPDVISFNRDIRPIMSNTCFKCHGADVANNKGEFRLDQAASAYAPIKDKSGRVRRPIVPGKPAESEVWRRISSAEPDEVMPPPDSLHQLSEHDRALIKRWIEQGAKYEAHWAYITPAKVPPPAVSAANQARVRNPIDQFVLKELESRNIAPAPEADRRTLIRRVSLDLTGLPPRPDEVEAFVEDKSPDAYERLVDRLLASPHFGERMAVPWLDLVRFADTVGFHGDQRQNIFPYRDYVIDSFNRNKPFDQFTIEQIAGDLLPNATPEQRTASGFNRLNMMTREGGAQPKEYLAKYAADRVRAVSTAWLGSTVGCAECHDHKYDPFTTRDFYALAAYFADIKQWGVYADYGYTPEPELKGFNNDFPFPPEIEVESKYLQRRLARFRQQLDERVQNAARSLLADGDAAAAVRAWAADVAPRIAADPHGWAPVRAETAKAAANTAADILPDGSVRFTDTGKVSKATKRAQMHTLVLTPPPGPVATVRLDALPDETYEGRVMRDDAPFFTVRLELALQRAGETKPQPLAVAEAYAEGETETYDNAYVEVSVRREWRSSRNRKKEAQSAWFLLREPLVLAEGDRLVATVRSPNIARVALAVSPLGGRMPGETLTAEASAALRAAEPTPAQRELIAAEYFRGMGGPDREAFAAALKDLHEIAQCREGRAFTMVTASVEPRVTRVLPRGNWQDDSGEIVQPSPPEFLLGGNKQSRADAPRQTRLDLARWIASRDNPLTARVFVNRLWKHCFGTGLSAVLDDVGMQGEFPSHPELLDWLAVEFVDRGWDVKAMLRLIVTSATYRQSSKYRPELAETDPDNRLLARQNPRRLAAEFVRDNALAAAGLINLEIGGPSATPYQPEGYYAQLNFPIRDYIAETDERQYRRGVYMHWQRTFIHPMLANFDAPSREECTAARTISSTPQQALTLLNDPTFVEAARVLAEQVLVLQPDGSFAARLDEAFRRALARPPSARERESLERFLGEQLEYYRANPDDARKLTSVGLHPAPAGVDRGELAAWTSLTRVLLNLNETIVRY